MAPQPVTIDGIPFDCYIEEKHDYENRIPEYPVEEGFVISDSIIVLPEKLDLTLILSNYPITHKGNGYGPGKVQALMQQLQATAKKKELVTVVTNDRVFQNFAIVSVSENRRYDLGDSVGVDVSLQEVRITSTRTTNIPSIYSQGGQTGANAGSANTSRTTSNANGSSGSSSSGGSGSSSSSGSLLYGLAKKFGLVD